MAVQRRRGTLRGSSGVECRWRPDDLDPQPADCRDERVVIWDRRGGGARERRPPSSVNNRSKPPGTATVRRRARGEVTR
jgi:hypothetical protein